MDIPGEKFHLELDDKTIVSMFVFFSWFLLLKSTSWGKRSYFASYEKWTNGSILIKIKESEIAEEILVATQ